MVVNIRIGDQVIVCAEPAPISECSNDSFNINKLVSDYEIGNLAKECMMSLELLAAKMNLPAGKYVAEFELTENKK